MSAVDVVLPKWGMSMQEGTITEWYVEVGDEVLEGDVIAEVETEKVNGEVEAPANGTISEITVAAGETAEVGTVLARVEPT